MTDEPSAFLYPFINGESPDDAGVLLEELAASARSKVRESRALARSTVDSNAELIAVAAAEMAHRLTAGGRLFTCGNGGSCTDSALLAALFARPPFGKAFPAWTLAADQAALTALANDVGFSLVFARQLIARGRPGDIVAAVSTSGNSPNLLAALGEAHQRGMYTISFAGYAGGAFAQNPDVDACFIVGSQSVHRIQEAQAFLGYHLWLAVQDRADRQEVR